MVGSSGACALHGIVTPWSGRHTEVDPGRRDAGSAPQSTTAPVGSGYLARVFRLVHPPGDLRLRVSAGIRPASPHAGTALRRAYRPHAPAYRSKVRPVRGPAGSGVLAFRPAHPRAGEAGRSPALTRSRRPASVGESECLPRGWAPSGSRGLRAGAGKSVTAVGATQSTPAGAVGPIEREPSCRDPHRSAARDASRASPLAGAVLPWPRCAARLPTATGVGGTARRRRQDQAPPTAPDGWHEQITANGGYLVSFGVAGPEQHRVRRPRPARHRRRRGRRRAGHRVPEDAADRRAAGQRRQR